MLFVSLSACGKSGSEDAGTANQQPTQAANNQADDEKADDAASDSTGTEQKSTEDGESRILIVYFTAAENSGVDAVSSASDTMIDGEAVGRVRAVAEAKSDVQEWLSGLEY